MAERAVEVVALEGERVALRALGACSDCVGCGGRCDMFRAEADDQLHVSRTLFPRPPRVGEHWRLALADDELLRQSLRGHGAALAGLVLGAAAGYVLARALDVAPDVWTAVAALAGTLLAISRSKRASSGGLRVVDSAHGT